MKRPHSKCSKYVSPRLNLNIGFDTCTYIHLLNASKRVFRNFTNIYHIYTHIFTYALFIQIGTFVLNGACTPRCSTPTSVKYVYWSVIKCRVHYCMWYCLNGWSLFALTIAPWRILYIIFIYVKWLQRRSHDHGTEVLLSAEKFAWCWAVCGADFYWIKRFFIHKL